MRGAEGAASTFRRSLSVSGTTLGGVPPDSRAVGADAWVLRDPRVTTALIGASRWSQIEDSLGALDNLQFTADELTGIDRYAVDGGTALWVSSSSESWVDADFETTALRPLGRRKGRRKMANDLSPGPLSLYGCLDASGFWGAVVVEDAPLDLVIAPAPSPLPRSV